MQQQDLVVSLPRLKTGADRGEQQAVSSPGSSAERPTFTLDELLSVFDAKLYCASPARGGGCASPAGFRRATAPGGAAGGLSGGAAPATAVARGAAASPAPGEGMTVAGDATAGGAADSTPTELPPPAFGGGCRGGLGCSGGGGGLLDQLSGSFDVAARTLSPDPLRCGSPAPRGVSRCGSRSCGTLDAAAWDVGSEAGGRSAACSPLPGGRGLSWLSVSSGAAATGGGRAAAGAAGSGAVWGSGAAGGKGPDPASPSSAAGWRRVVASEPGLTSLRVAVGFGAAPPDSPSCSAAGTPMGCGLQSCFGSLPGTPTAAPSPLASGAAAFLSHSLASSLGGACSSSGGGTSGSAGVANAAGGVGARDGDATCVVEVAMATAVEATTRPPRGGRGGKHRQKAKLNQSLQQLAGAADAGAAQAYVDTCLAAYKRQHQGDPASLELLTRHLAYLIGGVVRFKLEGIIPWAELPVPAPSELADKSRTPTYKAWLCRLGIVPPEAFAGDGGTELPSSAPASPAAGAGPAAADAGGGALE